MPHTLRFVAPAALALAAAACSTSSASAQPDARRADAPLATLVTPDEEMRLTLTNRSLSVGFTARGRRRIRRAADSAFAATHVPYGGKDASSGRTRSGRAGDVSDALGGATAEPAGGDGPETPDKPIPLRDVETVRASGDSLLLCFASKPGPGPAAPPCSEWRRFLITGLPPAEAQRFADTVRRTRASAVRRPT